MEQGYLFVGEGFDYFVVGFLLCLRQFRSFLAGPACVIPGMTRNLRLHCPDLFLVPAACGVCPGMFQLLPEFLEPGLEFRLVADHSLFGHRLPGRVGHLIDFSDCAHVIVRDEGPQPELRLGDRRQVRRSGDLLYPHVLTDLVGHPGDNTDILPAGKGNIDPAATGQVKIRPVAWHPIQFERHDHRYVISSRHNANLIKSA